MGPKGGEGGEPTIVGMDQVKNKKGFVHKTMTENGEIDIPYLLEKNPKLRKKIEESPTFGNRGLSTYVSVSLFLLAPAIPLLINSTIPYRMSKNEVQYLQNPRRYKSTKGKSKENETSRFRQETEKESQIISRDFTNTSTLDRSLLEKSKEFSELIGENHYEQIVDQLKIEEQDFDNKIANYQSQEHSLEIDLNLKQQSITQLETELNQYQSRLNQLRQENLESMQEEALKLGEELELITRQQELRDKRNEKALTQNISVTNLQTYSKFHGQYQEEYNKMKKSLSEYKNVKEILLKKKQEENAKIENELAKLTKNLKENRKKLSYFKDEKLKLLTDEAILREDILEKTQEEVQHEHEYEINCLLDQDIDIPRSGKFFLNKIEKHPFTPFVRKLTDYDQKNENLLYFQVWYDSLSEIKDDQLVEHIVLLLIKFDLTQTNFRNNITELISKNCTQKDEQILSEFETRFESQKIKQFNPYSILIESFKSMVNLFKNISQTKFNLNQIERFYRGIHYSFKIDINKINENIEKMKVINDNLNDFELNKIFVNFIKQIEIITIEKFLDKMNKIMRNNLLKNLKLVLNYLNNRNEEMMFFDLDKDFLNQLSNLRKELGNFNNSFLINMENGLKNIEKKRFLQDINIIDDVEQMIQIFDSRRLFRLEHSSIDFHHNDLHLTELELEMLGFNENPTFEGLISLATNFDKVITSKKNSFFGGQMKNDTKFFEVIIHNFDYFAQSTLDSNLLEKFKEVINKFSDQQLRQELLQKIENKKYLDELIAFLKQKDLSPKIYDEIVNKLLSSDIDLDEDKKTSIKEKINDGKIQLLYEELCSLIHPDKVEDKYDQLDETNQDMNFIKIIQKLIKEKFLNVNLENMPLSSIERVIETTLVQVFDELYDTYNDGSSRDEAKTDYKVQIK
ncbi:unnamed protein product [Didymodactylos carnosus]|uniref:Uncharacterized protein n=1 Tax=Didymodactylos carnosus TaxID=1234261 RepID=A0A814ZIM7_9BILA|nr:unnamed protein product [Didymodactylos carnosus]CAF4006202.1 unnamed protein product [Didymodactylos carnosus]